MTLQTVERALSFLEFVAAARTPPTVREVSTGLELNITTCYHLMRTLLARGYLERRTDSTLRLGSSVGSLFQTYQLGLSPEETLTTITRELAADTSETAFLSALDDRTVVLRTLVEGSQPLRVSGLYVGLSGDEHRRASGRAVLAHAEHPLRTEILERSLSGLSPEARGEVLRELDGQFEEIRAVGWAVDQQTSPGITAVGAPFFRNGTVAGAVGIVALTPRFTDARDDVLRRVSDAARAVTQALADGRPR